jgi:CheY-specific phosphatase CheX
MNDPNELRARYGLRPLPPGVGKIADLVKEKQSASMDRLTKIIGADSMMTQRLVTMAFPKVAARTGATVQSATSRLGVNRIILVIVGDILKEAVTETFETMVSIPLQMDDLTEMPISPPGQLTGSVKFTGKAHGQVTLGFSRNLTTLVATRLTGGNLDDEYPEEILRDAIGEIVNIVTGNLQSRLQDAGLPSEVSVPEVTRPSGFPNDTIPGGSSERFFFHQGSNNLTVNLSIAPFPS